MYVINYIIYFGEVIGKVKTAFHFAELSYMEITIWATAIYFKWVYTPDHAYDSE